LTGDWEFKLHQIQRRQKSRAEFMSEIADMTRTLSRAPRIREDTIPGDFGVLKVPCPKCGGEVHEKYKQFQCVNEKCDLRSGKRYAAGCLRWRKWKSSSRKTSGPLQNFRSKKGFPFAAVLKLNAEFKMEFDFGDGQKGENGEAARRWISPARNARQMSQVRRAGVRPGMNYICEKRRPGQDLHVPHRQIILQQEISPEQ